MYALSTSLLEVSKKFRKKAVINSWVLEVGTELLVPKKQELVITVME